jgi:hypothetical protein
MNINVKAIIAALLLLAASAQAMVLIYRKSDGGVVEYCTRVDKLPGALEQRIYPAGYDSTEIGWLEVTVDSLARVIRARDTLVTVLFSEVTGEAIGVVLPDSTAFSVPRLTGK